MIYVVNKETNMVLAKFEAWTEDAMDKAARYVAKAGVEYLDQEITFMGDMVIWVR